MKGGPPFGLELNCLDIPSAGIQAGQVHVHPEPHNGILFGNKLAADAIG